MADGNSAAVDVFVSVGSNIEPERNLRLACNELEQDFGDLSLSPVYRNPAVGFEGDDFLNMVIGFQSADAPEHIVARMEELHRKAKRVRQQNPYSPRTLDVDVLLYGDLVRRRLKLPHGDIDKYGFVLGPLAEIAPDIRHPVNGKTMQALWNEFDESDCPMTQVDIGLN